MDYEIRESKDFELIASLLSESPALVRHPTAKKLEKEYKQGARFFVIYTDSEPCGTICVKKVTFFMSEIKYLYVKPECRNLGLGRALVLHATNYANQQFKTPVKVAVTQVTNSASIHIFMDYAGYKPVTEFKSPLSENLLVLLMRTDEISRADIEYWEM